MANTATIHQVNYLPWIGFFSKIQASDVFILLDTVDYVKNNWQNRNKIKTPQGWCYMTIPIPREHYRTKFNNVRLPRDSKWAVNHMKTLITSYSRAPYYKHYAPLLKSIYDDVPNIEYLDDLNSRFIFLFMKELGINTKIVRASELKIEDDLNATSLLVALLNTIDADKYISGVGGKNYLDETAFKEAGIKLVYHEYMTPEYSQLWGEFIPNLSIVDLAFNMGEESYEIIKKGGTIKNN
jgi:hypothetical protein